MMPGDHIVTLDPREAGKLIASLSKDVHIKDHKVTEIAAVIAKRFRSNKFSLDGWKAHPLHPKEASEEAIDVIFAIDVLNFSFWPDIPGKKFGITYNGKLHTGYWSLVAALRRAKDEGIPVYDAKYMAGISEAEFKDVFRSDTGIEIPLLSKRWQGFVESGKILMEKFGGSFVNCLRQTDKDAVALLKLIIENFPSFRDEAVFGNQRVGFYKRAQILVADIWLCFEGKDLGEFNNISEITMFADYRVPQTLEFFEILKYSDSLKKVLNERVIMAPGDRRELEIRGTAIEATERLVREVKRLLAADGVCDSNFWTVNAITVDNFLWDYAREHRATMNHLAFHLVRTIFY